MKTSRPLLLDSITTAGPDAKGRVVVCGSHGGLFPAALAARAGVRAILLNDAGIGRDGAGIAGVLALGDAGIAAAAVAHDSARIGDAGDTLARGRISAVNARAAALGIAPGDSAGAAVVRLAGAQPVSGARFPEIAEARSERGLANLPGAMVLIDSVSLLVAEDAGRIVITGSHGGLVGGRAATAAKVDAGFLAFSDAGVGADQAGISRLPALEARGIAAVTVGHDSARIGDAASILGTGIISHANAPARAAGLVPGQPLEAALRRLEPAALSGARRAP